MAPPYKDPPWKSANIQWPTTPTPYWEIPGFAQYNAGLAKAAGGDQYPTMNAVYGVGDMRQLRNAGYSDAQIEAMAVQKLAERGYTGPNAVVNSWNASAAKQKSAADAYKAYTASVPGLGPQGQFSTPAAAQAHVQFGQMFRPPQFQASVYKNRGGFGNSLTPSAYEGYVNRGPAPNPFGSTWHDPLTGMVRPVDPRLGAPYTPGYQAPRSTNQFGMADIVNSPVFGSGTWRRKMNLSDIR